MLPESDNITRVENEDLHLICAAVCKPNCSYTWTKDGIVVSSQDVLEFRSIDRDDRGTYTCRASNGPSEETKVHIEVLSKHCFPNNIIKLLFPEEII